MTQPGRRIEWLVWAGLLLIILTLLLVFALAAVKARRSIPNPPQVYGTVSDFVLTNQTGKVVTLAELRGHVWIADIIFTRCAGPCPEMTRQMRELQKALAAEKRDARLVTLTTDPEFDTPPVMKRYADRFDADTVHWLFLTGDKEQIASLARDSLKLAAVEKTPSERQTPADLFIHSTLFVVVDKHARLRGVFETVGEGIDPASVRADILSLVHRLESER